MEEYSPPVGSVLYYYNMLSQEQLDATMPGEYLAWRYPIRPTGDGWTTMDGDRLVLKPIVDLENGYIHVEGSPGSHGHNITVALFRDSRDRPFLGIAIYSWAGPYIKTKITYFLYSRETWRNVTREIWPISISDFLNETLDADKYEHYLYVHTLLPRYGTMVEAKVISDAWSGIVHEEFAPGPEREKTLNTLNRSVNKESIRLQWVESEARFKIVTDTTDTD